MSDNAFEPAGIAVPHRRIARLARMGSLASGVAGGMAWSGARGLLRGERPNRRDLLLTPENAARITRELARMRGAAMKVGQLLSMESREMLPPELADILAHLRNDAHFMPPAQLKRVLSAQWGADFMTRFSRFDVRPLAAASIGQVHRAITRDGRDLAIKVQYPGVRASIDSDVDNVATLVRLSGLLPEGIDLAPLLDEAKTELHLEADYTREGRALSRAHDLFDSVPGLRVPRLHADLTTPDILAMDHVDAVPIETLDTAPQDLRDRIAGRLLRLVFDEIFVHGVMQTDPNFANFRYAPDTGDVVLLDFGATRDIAPETAAAYARILRAGRAGDRGALHAAALAAGFYTADAPTDYVATILDMMQIALAPLFDPAPFDFAATDLADRMRDRGMALAHRRDYVHVPPMDTLLIQRKVGGMFLLAARLAARVPLAPLLDAAVPR